MQQINYNWQLLQLTVGVCLILLTWPASVTQARFITTTPRNDPDIVTMAAAAAVAPSESVLVRSTKLTPTINKISTLATTSHVASTERSSSNNNSNDDDDDDDAILSVTPMKLHPLIPVKKITTTPISQSTMMHTTPSPLESRENVIDVEAVTSGTMTPTSSSTLPPTRLLPEKRAKFINDNATNAQQLSWPNAAEVGSLVAMKSVPKPTILIATTTTTPTTSSSNVTTVSPPLFINRTELPNEIEWMAKNQTEHLTEKHLLDWQKIMMHGALAENRTEFVVSTTLDATERATVATTLAVVTDAESTTTTEMAANLDLLSSATEVSNNNKSVASTVAIVMAETTPTSILLPEATTARPTTPPPTRTTTTAATTTTTHVTADPPLVKMATATTTSSTTTTTPTPMTRATSIAETQMEMETQTKMVAATEVSALNVTPIPISHLAMKANENNENTDKPTSNATTPTTTTIIHYSNDGSRADDDVIAVATTTPTPTTTVQQEEEEQKQQQSDEQTLNDVRLITVSTSATGVVSTTSAPITTIAEEEIPTTTSLTTTTTSPPIIKIEQIAIIPTTLIKTTTTIRTTIETTTSDIGQISNEVNLETITEKSAELIETEVTSAPAIKIINNNNKNNDDHKKESSEVNDLLITEKTKVKETEETTTTTTPPTTTTTTTTTTEAITIKSLPIFTSTATSTTADNGKTNNSDPLSATTTTATPITTTTTTTSSTTISSILNDLKATSKLNPHESSLETNNISETLEATADTSHLATTAAAAAAAKAATTTVATVANTTTATTPSTVVAGVPSTTALPNALDETLESTTKAPYVVVVGPGNENKVTSSEIYDEDNVDPDNEDNDQLQLVTRTTTKAAAAATGTTMATATTPTTTTTSTTTTTEGPLISLLDDSTTSKITTTASTTSTTTIKTTEKTIPSTESDFISSSSSNTMLPPVEITTTATTTTTTAGIFPTHPDLDNLQQPNTTNANGGTDVNVIIAITVSVIGVVALILLVAFLYLMRKRQKQMSYGQRCRPVSLDAYSLDNVSVLGSVRRKGRDLRASKRTYGNAAFDDPSLRHNHLSANELAKFIERRSSIFDEFRDVPQIIARADEVPQGCEDRNRYANVIPLPETRVVLQRQNDDDKTEYINANYVRGPRDAPNYYIACQAPLESTTSDFWRMIWEQQSRVIIQATDLNENGIEKCAEYLPPSATLDNHSTYGDYQVTLKHREVKDKYAISTLMLKQTDGSECRELTHYWYKWPETGVPAEEAPIIAMLLEARSSLKSYAIEQSNELKEKSSTLTLKSMESSKEMESKAAEVSSTSSTGGGSTGNAEINGNVASKGARNQQGPLTIHCSPGTGRTGTIITCDMAIRSLETPKRSVDIPQLVYYVRRGRASAVQTKEQYEFIYKVANMYATKITNLSNDN